MINEVKPSFIMIDTDAQGNIQLVTPPEQLIVTKGNISDTLEVREKVIEATPIIHMSSFQSFLASKLS